MKAWHPKQIKFKADKNGRVNAYGWRPMAKMWVRMNFEEAKILIAAEEAEEVKA